MKKTFFIVLLSLLLITPVLVFAGGTNCPSEGLVPCGTDSCPCDFCDLFKMFDRILDTLLFAIVPVLAALMIVVGGAYYVISQGKPEVLSKAKSVFVSIAIGLLIIYGAWLLINLFLMTLGVTAWDGPGEEWFKIECSSSSPGPGINSTTPSTTPPTTAPSTTNPTTPPTVTPEQPKLCNVPCNSNWTCTEADCDSVPGCSYLQINLNGVCVKDEGGQSKGGGSTGSW